MRLVKCAWRDGCRGLAALLAVAWDSQLSPVDTRSLKANQFRRDPVGTWFEVDRAKTGRQAFATLARRSQRLLAAYFAQLQAQPVGFAPIFRNRSSRPYSKDTLGDDFRTVRTKLFGEKETRQLADFRRSGSVKALAGEVPPEKLSNKMANSLSTSNRLHKTYGLCSSPLCVMLMPRDSAGVPNCARSARPPNKNRTKGPGCRPRSSRTLIRKFLSH